MHAGVSPKAPPPEGHQERLMQRAQTFNQKRCVEKKNTHTLTGTHTHTLTGTHTHNNFALCVAGVAQPDIHQAWHNLTSTFVSRGRRGTHGTGWRAWTGLGAFDAAALCVAGVAQTHTHTTHTHTLDKNGSLYDPAGTES